MGEATEKMRSIGIREGLPTEEISGLMAEHESVSLRVVRQNMKGQWAALGLADWRMEPKDMLVLEDKIDEYCGGGTFLVEVRNPKNPTDLLLPRFKLIIQKPPRPVRNMNEPAAAPGMHSSGYASPAYAPQAYAAPTLPTADEGYLFASHVPSPVPAPRDPSMSAFNRPFLPPQDELPPFVRGLSPDEQWHYHRQMHPPQAAQLPPGASIPSDRMALFTTERIQSELAAERARSAKLEERLEALAKQNEKAIEDQRLARERAEREAQEAKHKAELAALEAKIAAVSAANQAKKETSLEDWAKLLVPLAPVFSAFVTTRKDEAKIEAEKEMKRQELAQAQTTQMMAALVGKKDDSMATMMPLILKMMETNSPSARADAQVATAEVQMMQIKMLSDMLREQNSGPEQPVWYPLVERMLEGLQGALAMQQYAKAQEAQRAPIHVQPQPPAALPAPAGYTPEASPVVRAVQEAPAPRHEPARVSIMPQAPQAVQAAPQQQPEEDEQEGPSVEPINLDWSSYGFGTYMRRNPTAANITKLVYQNLPPEFDAFRTNEWRHIIFELHANTAADHLGHIITEYLDYLADNEALPAPLANVFEEPEAALQLVIGVLPVAQANPEYAMSVVKSTADNIRQLLARLEAEMGDEEDEDDTDEDEGEENAESPPYQAVSYNGNSGEIVEHEDAFETATGVLAGSRAN